MKERKFVQSELVKTDCLHYKGHIPCAPHKQHNVHCSDCTHYLKTKGHLLVIKLGAMGDVMRTTPLLFPIRTHYPQHFIHWITDYPEALPREPWINRVYKYDAKSVVTLSQISFDSIYCLDKDIEAAALASSLKAHQVYGYIFEEGAVIPSTKNINSSSIAAEQHKWITGLFDDISKQNQLSYQEEIFHISGWDYQKEEYIMPPLKSYDFSLPLNKKKVGLNTGCGGRWSTRLWPYDYWKKLIELLQYNNFDPILLGGPEEDEKNQSLSKETDTVYFGVMPLDQFDALISQMDIVVTAVTMALHLAIGRKRKVIVLNNIFNKNEFELYDRGVILEPDPPCKCYYATTCPYGGCMDRISVERVFQSIVNFIG
ncbi:MAG: glycosyltransferase family 9 protein [bacterium]|nr:glycosyltransferase family 9 protein [bacterium]